VVRAAVGEMHRRLGIYRSTSGAGVARLLVRHLVMPNDVSGTRAICRFLSREISPNTTST